MSAETVFSLEIPDLFGDDDPKEFDLASARTVVSLSPSSEETQDLDAFDVLIDDESSAAPAARTALGPYQLTDELPGGAMADIYLARHQGVGERVAVKILRTPERTDGAAERLFQEWQILKRLDHPHIVRVVDFGAEPDCEYLVLEYVPGANLEHLVKEASPIPFQAAGELVRQVALGLAHVHAHGVIHRDIKPSNVIVTRFGTAKVIDFGVARESSGLASLTLAHGDNLLGTVDYMAPEQAFLPHQVDERADVYALGCTLYYLLTGQPPFNKGSMTTRLLMHRSVAPPAIALFRPEVPAELVAICERMMAKDPAKRIRSMHEVIAQISRWLDSLTDRNPQAVADWIATVWPDALPDADTELRRTRTEVHALFLQTLRSFETGRNGDEETRGVRAFAESLGQLRDQIALVFALELQTDLAEAAQEPRLADQSQRLDADAEQIFRLLVDLAEAPQRVPREYAACWLEFWLGELGDLFHQFQVHERRVLELASRCTSDELSELD